MDRVAERGDDDRSLSLLVDLPSLIAAAAGSCQREENV